MTERRVARGVHWSLVDLLGGYVWPVVSDTRGGGTTLRIHKDRGGSASPVVPQCERVR